VTDFEELLAERGGLRTTIVELKRENDLLRLRSIDLVAENKSLRGQLEQSRALAQLAND
jgi:hypothetical protein